jgi:hypothetical protein
MIPPSRRRRRIAQEKTASGATDHARARRAGLLVVAVAAFAALSGCEHPVAPETPADPETTILGTLRSAGYPAARPPPARPRGPGTAAARFRDAGTSSAAAARPSAAMPPPPSPPSPSLDEEVAQDVARSEPAAPPVVAPAAPPPPIDPASIIGATAAMIEARFGAPERQARIGSGTMWHYERAACRASFVLLPELASGSLRVFSHEITPPDGAMFGPAGCLGRIAAGRGGDRTAGLAP